MDQGVLYRASVKPDFRHIQDPKVTLAYGNNQYPELLRHLTSSNKDVRVSGLKVLKNAFAVEKGIAEAKASSPQILDSLQRLLADKEVNVRILTSEILVLMSSRPAGRLWLKTNGTL